MISKKLEDICLPSKEEDLLWEIFHENTKVGRHYSVLPQHEITARMKRMYEAFPYEDYVSISLPKTLSKLHLSLGEAILSRVTSRNMEPVHFSLEQIRTIFHYANGVTRDNKETKYPRSFRTTPSGGGLYPLELYFHSAQVEGLKPGIYHYDPMSNSLQCIRPGDRSLDIKDCLAPVQNHIATTTSMMIFITGVFERETFKYGPRGYRFVFLEAGHVAQNINLVATAMGLGSINIAGYFDREVDEMLGLDGIAHSTIYMIGIGKSLEE